MAIRLRRTDAGLVALCAARSVRMPGDVYLDDEMHSALYVKFSLDLASEGFLTADAARACVGSPLAAAMDREESNNANRTEWDRTFAARKNR